MRVVTADVVAVVATDVGEKGDTVTVVIGVVVIGAPANLF
jgi:hypothetical protein